ncbi:phage terminase large subunit [Aurantimonas sp. C2-6-R+9]|nr:phage terminase large subunit [Aurantimonas sp. C2-6-R+9]MEC5412888.1 phage terminase large subunit [Aurantimonas sp. C2-4-R8]
MIKRQRNGAHDLADGVQPLTPMRMPAAEAARRRVLEALLRQNLGAFTERCFNEISPAQPYAHNWHLDALAFHLGEVAAGRIRRLLITLPPRSLKSISASVAFPAWLLGHDPSRRIVCVSYARDLTVAHANSCRAVMRAHWYKALFPFTRVDPAKDTETEMRTTGHGYRLATTVGGTLTGRGGSIIIIDDPMKAADAASDLARQKANVWFNETLLSRLDNKQEDAIILVMQRLHVDDLAGHVLNQGDWIHLDLPAIAEAPARIQIGPDRFHDRAIGEALHPAREPVSELRKLKLAMGSAAFSAQYQQTPVPPGGHMVQWGWFGFYRDVPRKSAGERIVQSWDTASKANELSDYSVGITAQVGHEAVYILDLVRERLDYPALKKRIVLEKQRWRADDLLIEDKGSGTSLIQDLMRDQCYAIAATPEADKVVRMSACSARIEAGAVFCPARAPWLDDFKAELLAFPYGRHDDQVDALSQLLNWMRNRSTYNIGAWG